MFCRDWHKYEKYAIPLQRNEAFWLNLYPFMVKWDSTIPNATHYTTHSEYHDKSIHWISLVRNVFSDHVDFRKSFASAHGTRGRYYVAHKLMMRFIQGHGRSGTSMTTASDGLQGEPCSHPICPAKDKKNETASYAKKRDHTLRHQVWLFCSMTLTRHRCIKLNVDEKFIFTK